MASIIADSLASLAVGVIVAIALATVPTMQTAPRKDEKHGRRLAFGTLFLLAGEVIVLVSESGDWLRAGLILLQAAVLLLAEFATAGSAGGVFLVSLLWIGCGAVGIWQWSALGAWVAAHRPWVLIGAAVGAILCGLIASRRRRIAVDRYTMWGM